MSGKSNAAPTTCYESVKACYAMFDGYPDLLTPAHVAEIMGRNVVTVRRLCASGDLPAVKIGRDWYIPKPALIEHVNVSRNLGK